LVNPREILKSAFDSAIMASQPGPAVIRNLPSYPSGKTVIIGAGKGAIPMAIAVENTWENPQSGLVIAPYSSKTDFVPRNIEVCYAGHPIPDVSGVNATMKVLNAVSDLSKDDLVICLFSGGGSALLTYPEGVNLACKRAATEHLLLNGASIQEINILRKHLSGVKGGKLANTAYPAKVVSLIVSDVVGDDLSIIASGPTVPDQSTYRQSLSIVEKYEINDSELIEHLINSSKNEFNRTNQDAHIFNQVENKLIVTASQAIEAVKEKLNDHGITADFLNDRVEGESKIVAIEHAQKAKSLSSGQAIITGGETTVKVSGSGTGGPNQEYLLSLAQNLQGEENIYALAADTDGIDGSSNSAGAVILPDTLERAKAMDITPEDFLENNDTYSFFSALGDSIVTGPTGTNVNDIRIIIRL
jgi:hydroxypyruvate reductase